MQVDHYQSEPKWVIQKGTPLVRVARDTVTGQLVVLKIFKKPTKAIAETAVKNLLKEVNVYD